MLQFETDPTVFNPAESEQSGDAQLVVLCRAIALYASTTIHLHPAHWISRAVDQDIMSFTDYDRKAFSMMADILVSSPDLIALHKQFDAVYFRRVLAERLESLFQDLEVEAPVPVRFQIKSFFGNLKRRRQVLSDVCDNLDIFHHAMLPAKLSGTAELDSSKSLIHATDPRSQRGLNTREIRDLRRAKSPSPAASEGGSKRLRPPDVSWQGRISTKNATKDACVEVRISNGSLLFGLMQRGIATVSTTQDTL